MPSRLRTAFFHEQNVANFKAHLLTATDDAQHKVIEGLLAEEMQSEAERLKRLSKDGG